MIAPPTVRKCLKRAGIAGALLVPGALLGTHWAIQTAAAGRAYADAAAVPPHPAALVLGCAKILPNGRPNRFFRHRIEAAAALFHAGRVEYLIVSGDNHRAGYDEPTDMRGALVEAGVPGDRIYRDYAGFRTLDSVVRARAVFGQERLVIVSQSFHTERAVFIALHRGIEAVAYPARDVAGWGGLRTRARESLARLRTVLDVWVLGTAPRFLGPPVILGEPEGESS